MKPTFFVKGSIYAACALFLAAAGSTMNGAIASSLSSDKSVQDGGKSWKPEVSTPELEAAASRVSQAKTKLDQARKQLTAAKAMLRAAEAEYKAYVADHTALSLRTQAQRLADASGLQSTPATTSEPVPVSTAAAPPLTPAPVPAGNMERIRQVDFNAEPAHTPTAQAPLPSEQPPSSIP